MKRFLVGLCVIMLLILPMSALAQDGGDGDNPETPPKELLEYGASVSGEITNSDFEHLYYFEGTAGDVVVISLSQANEVDGLDPYLYLTTEDNELLAQNDDGGSLNARIVYRIQEDGIYQIVATRLGDRTGTTTGEFVLDLEQPPVAETDTVIEGTLLDRTVVNSHVIVPEEDGIYTITYKHITGNYYPNIMIQTLAAEDYYYQEVGILTAPQLLGGSLTVELIADQVYIVTTQENYYDYDYSNQRAVYTLEVTMTE